MTKVATGMNTVTKSIFMVEDEALLSDLFAEFIQLMPELEFLGSCGDGRIAMSKCLELKPDIIILDIRLPEVNGLEMLMLLRKRLPETKILIFSGSLTTNTVQMTLQCQADGFVEKAFGLEELKKAIRQVLEGEKYYSKGAEDIRRRLQG